jgi:hypothetical protein
MAKAWRGIKMKSHKPHGKLGNPHPNKENLILKTPIGEISEPLSKSPIAVRLPQSIHDLLAKIPQEDKLPLLRNCISEAVKKYYDMP